MKTIKELARQYGKDDRAIIRYNEMSQQMLVQGFEFSLVELTQFAQAYMQDRLNSLEPLGLLAKESFGRGQIFWFKEAPKDGTKIYDISTLKD